jgi:hypothetical protein
MMRWERFMSPTWSGVKSLRVSWMEPMMYNRLYGQYFSKNITVSKMSDRIQPGGFCTPLIPDIRSQRQQASVQLSFC